MGVSMKSAAGLVLLAGLAAACSHQTLGAALASRPLQIDRFKPARFDAEASVVTLEAPASAVESVVDLRKEIASALNAELDESTVGRSTTPARFRAKISTAESYNVWSWLGWIPPLGYPVLLPLYDEDVDLTARIELGLQIGDGFYAGVGSGSASCFGMGPREPCFHEALGLAINQALNQLQGPQRVVSLEGQR